jgi:hypothetical protein
MFGPPEQDCATRAYFDELLAANELGLALEALCDWLLDSRDAIITPLLLDAVSSLHTKMYLDDDCVEQLRRKALHGDISSAVFDPYV